MSEQKQKTLMEATPIITEKKYKNISELPYFLATVNTENVKDKKQDGTPFEVNCVVVDKKYYRIPNKVLKACQLMKQENPTIVAFRVMRTGTTKEDTSYTPIPLMQIPA